MNSGSSNSSVSNSQRLANEITANNNSPFSDDSVKGDDSGKGEKVQSTQNTPHSQETETQLTQTGGAPGTPVSRAQSLHESSGGLSAAQINQQHCDDQWSSVDEDRVYEQRAKNAAIDKQVAAEKPVAEKRVAEKLVAEKRVAKKPIAKKRVAKKQVGKKAVAKKAVARKLVAGKKRQASESSSSEEETMPPPKKRSRPSRPDPRLEQSSPDVDMMSSRDQVEATLALYDAGKDKNVSSDDNGDPGITLGQLLPGVEAESITNACNDAAFFAKCDELDKQQTNALYELADITAKQRKTDKSAADAHEAECFEQLRVAIDMRIREAKELKQKQDDIITKKRVAIIDRFTGLWEEAVRRQQAISVTGAHVPLQACSRGSPGSMGTKDGPLNDRLNSTRVSPNAQQRMPPRLALLSPPLQITGYDADFEGGDDSAALSVGHVRQIATTLQQAGTPEDPSHPKSVETEDEMSAWELHEASNAFCDT